MSCVEGAVIAADSMWLVGNPATEWYLAQKIYRLDRWQGAYTTYGAWAAAEPQANFMSTVGLIQGRIRSLAAYVVNRAIDEQAALIAAGTDDGVMRLVKWSGVDCTVAPKGGAVFQLGYARFWNGDADVPKTLVGCLALAVRIASETIQSEYEKCGGKSLDECVAAGKLPGVSYPLNFIMVRPGRIGGIELCHL